jgi:hypothetical protein
VVAANERRRKRGARNLGSEIAGLRDEAMGGRMVESFSMMCGWIGGVEMRENASRIEAGWRGCDGRAEAMQNEKRRKPRGHRTEFIESLNP